MTELKPCPCCKWPAILKLDEYNGIIYGGRVVCSNFDCLLSTPYCQNHYNAIRRWNRRFEDGIDVRDVLGGVRMKEIHFFESKDDEDDWYIVQKVNEVSVWVADDYKGMKYVAGHVNDGECGQIIATTQMCYLDTRWLEEGYRIFVHDHTGTFEIVLGDGNERTSRYIRYAHDLFKLWRNGEFGLREEKE